MSKKGDENINIIKHRLLSLVSRPQATEKRSSKQWPFLKQNTRMVSKNWNWKNAAIYDLKHGLDYYGVVTFTHMCCSLEQQC